MAAESSWSLRGVDPRARAIARSAAKREGITIGEWLNRQLLEDGETAGSSGGEHAGSYDDPEALAHVLDRLSRRIEAAEHRSTLAITGIDQSVLSIISRLQGAEDLQSEFTERYTAALDELRATQKALHARIERMQRDGADAGGLEALKALEEALSKVANQVYDSEAETKAKLESLRAEMERSAKRIDKDVSAAREDAARTKREMESLITDRAEAGRVQIAALEGAVSDVNSRLGAAERDTDRAIKGLERTFATLDARVRRAESEMGAAGDKGAFAADIERRFEGLSRELVDMVSTTRAEIAGKMVDVARQEGVAALEIEFRSLAKQLVEVETKQKKTLARISEEVEKLASAVEARVRKSEIAAKVSISDVSRALAASQEATPAQAKELARLQARLKEAEARSAAAVEAVTRRVDAVDERLTERGGESGDDLTRRIRESEERTRSMIDGALSDINRRLDHADDQTASALSPVQRAIDTLRMRLESLEGANGGGPKPAGAAKSTAYNSLDELGADRSFAFGARAGQPPQADDASREPFADEFAFVPDLDDELRALESQAADSFEGERPARDGEDDGDASFDRMFGRANADAEARPSADGGGGGDLDFDPFTEDEPGRSPPSDFLSAAREAARNSGAAKTSARDERVSPGFGPAIAPATKGKKGRSLLFAAGGLAFLAVGAAGVIVLRDTPSTSGEGDDARAMPLDGLFANPTPPSAPVSGPAANASATPRSVADAATAAGELGVPVDLTGRAGEDFSLYAEGRDLYAPIRPEAPASGDALDALLTGAVGSPRTDTLPPTATPAPVATVLETAPEPVAAPEGEPEAFGIEAPASADELAIAEAAPFATVPFDAIETADATGQAFAPEAQPEIGARIEPVITLEQAAAEGDPVAQYELGASLLDRENLAEGVPLIRQASDSGLPAAQYRMGKLLETGRGVETDLPAARVLLESAAAAGHRNAMHSLGILFAEGRGAPQDFEEAARWFEEAALLGATDAQFNLAVLYQEGLGVPTSLSDAYAWFSIAGRAGDDEALRRAEALVERLDPEVRTRAEDAARRFSPRPLEQAVNGVFVDTPWTFSEAGVDLTSQETLARIQAALARLGYAPGPADGVMGAMTVAAIRAYQNDSGIAPTGAPDAALLEKLEADAGSL
jgi:localization factor PodJL